MRVVDARGDALIFSSRISPSRPVASQRPQRLQQAHWLTRCSSFREILLGRLCNLWQTVAFDDLEGTRAKSTIELAMSIGMVMDMMFGTVRRILGCAINVYRFR